MKRQINVLVVDDEVEVCNFFVFLLDDKGYHVSTAYTGQEMLQQLNRQSFDLALVDLRLPDTDGLKLLEQIKAKQSQCQVIIMTGYSTVKTAVDAIKLGAYDYVEKPFEEITDVERLIEAALKETECMSNQKHTHMVEELADNGFICCQDSPLIKILDLAKKIANKNLTVLIQGETGVGKEIVARYIHSQSPRANNPFIAVNCAAFTENLLESELFGHEKGSFTGAQSARKGIFQIANGGTLFLDEIGDASPGIQVKLLRVLESGEYLPVGGEKFQRTDIRVIAATNLPLAEAVASKKFREDLYYRLNAVILEIPPLRERLCDIELLAYYFARKLPYLDAREDVLIQPETLKMLFNYPWPGNVRELANVMARAVVLAERGKITTDTLPDIIINQRKQETPGLPWLAGEDTGEIIEHFSQVVADNLASLPVDLNDLTRRLKEAQYYIIRRIVQEALARAQGNREQAAREMNCTTRVLRYYLNERG
ncbi:sigma-54-dependent transcriptional regulator [Desulforamulus aeronauticus]|uniref:Stage 0 sporulation protein A homolog n=1 Tax=Desulforamulus aeronauticus DSM 10349 TaxID=1121421 RepID=A0A1M6PET2_9FIRM|nr:sigma-54 dependent transcriptional regulator [Desulforamulus aeronauticus]SHK06459.1 Response regulator receiver domain-containing protein [Desulforamulus aeronauticus DSM 10349]